MKQYGASKSTEFTRKQIGVLYYKAKNSELTVEKWFISKLYDASEYYGYDDNGSMEEFEGIVLDILDTMFNGDLAECQKLIEAAEERTYNLLSNKKKNAIDRSKFVA